MKVVGLISCVLVGFVLHASGAASLPMVDDFDDYEDTQAVTNGTDWSYVSEEGSILLLDSGSLSGKGVQVTNATLTLDVDESAGYSNVYVRLYAQATASESAPTVSDACAAMYIGSDSNIYVRNGASWSNAASAGSVGGWMGFVVHLNYGAGEYVVYADTSASSIGGVMTKIGDGPATMENNSNKLYEVIVDCGKKTVVDGVGVSRGFSAVSGAKDYVDVIELTADEYALVSFNELIYAAANDGLEESSRLSRELRGGLRVSDQVRVFNTNDWNYYTLQSGQEFNPVGGAMDLDEMDMTPETPMWVYRGGGQTSSLAFRTYDALVTEGANPGTPLFGTGDGPVDGWNQLGWTGGTDGVNDGDNIGFQDFATTGDYLYLYRSGAWRRLWWDGADWRYGRNVASYSMVENEGIWYLRRQAAGFTWDPQ